MKKYMDNRILRNVMLCLALLFAGCEHDYMTYDTSRKAGLYSIRERTSEIDTVQLISKAMIDTMISNYYFVVMGMPVDYDREVNLKVVETNVPEGKYSIGEHVVKAGEVTAVVPVKFYNDRDMEDGQSLYVIFRVEDNEEFNVLRELTPEKFCLINNIKAQQQPKWWMDDILGPFSIELYERMVSTFVALKESNPSLYGVMSESLGMRLENEPTTLIFAGFFFIEVYSGEMWSKFNYPMMKNVVYPLYDYYQEHPEEGVNVPKPNFYI